MSKYFLIIALLLTPNYGESSTTVSKKHIVNTQVSKKHVHATAKPNIKAAHSNKHKLHEKVKRANQSPKADIPMTDDKIRKIMEKYKVPEKDQEPIILAINNAVEKHRVSKKLIVAIIAKESSFKKRVVSKHGALGLMQVMPMHHISKPFDIHLNVDKGTELLASYIEDAGSLNGGLAKYGNSSHYIYEIQVTLNRIQKIAGT